MASELGTESEPTVSQDSSLPHFTASSTVHTDLSQPDFGYLCSDISYFQVLPTTAGSPGHLSLLKEEGTEKSVSMAPMTTLQDRDGEQQEVFEVSFQLTPSVDSMEGQTTLGHDELGVPTSASSTTAITDTCGQPTYTFSQFDELLLKDAGVPTSTELPTTLSVFDDTLAAAMEALAQASQVNNGFPPEAAGLIEGALEGTFGPDTPIACPVTSSSTSSPPDVLALPDRERSQAVPTTISATSTSVATAPSPLTFQGDESQKSNQSSGATNPINLPTSLSLRDGANRRVLMRPYFEKAVVDLLWASGELGPSSPQALLLAMWFYMSRHLGIGCRTDHARLLYGNLSIDVDPQTGSKHVHFVHTVHFGTKLLQPPSHNCLLRALPGQPERCPVALFEAFCARRPASAKLPDSPFYLQPDRNAHGSIWYLRSALGKNKIGSMLNTALQRVGLPIPRHVGFSRFCDALASVVLRNMREATCRQLVDLVTASKDDATVNNSRMEQIAHLAASLTASAVYQGSRIGEHLRALWENKRPPSPPLDSIAAAETSPHSFTAIIPEVSKSDQQLLTSPPPRPVCTLMTVQSPFGQEMLVPVQVTFSTCSPLVSISTASNALVQPQSGSQLRLADEPVKMVFPGSNLLPSSSKAQEPETAVRLGLVGIEALVPPSPHRLSSVADVTSTGCNDALFSPCDIQLDSCKSALGSSRSAKLELRELLELVMSAAPDTDSSSGAFSSTTTPPRSSSGLITQLLWRARALDDRGPWLLSFSMWWMLQHFFGISSRVHHVRLKWHHLRLVDTATDPMTGAPCEALEYVGPPEFSTVKSLALLESNRAGGEVRQRVYPSSGWAEPEISVAAMIAGGSLGVEVSARLRPLEQTSDVPTVPARPGPDFVALYKAFMRHRPVSSLVPDAPFYTQPLQSTRSQLTESLEVQREVWFSNSALGKNRIGALMRNIVDKVVRPRLPQLALIVKPISVAACRNAALKAARQTVIQQPTELDATVLARRVSLAEKLCSGLGVSSTGLRSLLEQNGNDDAGSTLDIAITPKPLPTPSATIPTQDSPAQPLVTFLRVSCAEGDGGFTTTQRWTDAFLESVQSLASPVPLGASGVIFTQADCNNGRLVEALKTVPLAATGQRLIIQQPRLSVGESQMRLPAPLCPGIPRPLVSTAFTAGSSTTPTTAVALPMNFVLLPMPSFEPPLSAGSLLTLPSYPLSAGPSQLLLSSPALTFLPTSTTTTTTTTTTTVVQDFLSPPVLTLAAATNPTRMFADSDVYSSLQIKKGAEAEGGSVLFHSQDLATPALTVSTPQTCSPALYTIAAADSTASMTMAQPLQPQYVTQHNTTAISLGTTGIDFVQVCQPQPSGFAPVPVRLLSLADIPQPANGAASLQVFSQAVCHQEPRALTTSVDQQAGGIVVSTAANNGSRIGLPGSCKNSLDGATATDARNLTTTPPERSDYASLQQAKADVVHSPPFQPPAMFRDPRPDELRTFHSVIQSTVALQCSNFPDYVSHLHRQGVLSLHKPWSLNFTAWFINSLAFCVENRTEHLALRWGDFQLGRCQETSTEYLCFYNRVSQQVYFLRANPTPSGTTGAAATAAGPETLCPCPVQVYKTLRERRPPNCQDALSKFYLQPRSLACSKANDTDLCEVPGPWFTEHSWGKNKLGGLLAEAAKIAGLPVIWLPKRRSYRKGTTSSGGAVYASFSAQKRPAPTPPSEPKQARTGPELLPPSSMQWTSPCSVATVVSPPSTLVSLDIDADGV